jgi:hypothetical protein
MGFWDSLFRKPLKISDAFFGEMLFMEVKGDPANSYFECWRFFKPINEEIEVGVSRSLEGPTQIQKDFFTQIESDYAFIIRRIAPLIRGNFQEWKIEFEINSFEKKFNPVYVFIPNCLEKPVVWEIPFESIPGFVSYNYPYILTIEMADYEPLHVSVSQ